MPATWVGSGRFAAAGGGGFNPADYGTVVGWWDSSNAGSITFGTGSEVAQLADLSGNARHLAEATNRPARTGTQNSLSTIVFDGSNDILTYDAGSDAVDLSPYMIFAVAKGPNSGSDVRLFATRNSAGGNWDYQSPNALLLNYSSTTTVNAWNSGSPPTAVAVTANSWELLRSSNNGSTLSVAVNGGTPNTASVSPPGNTRFLRIGGCSWTGGPPPDISTPFLGEVGEIILYNSTPSGADITTIESYLQAKWAV